MLSFKTYFLESIKFAKGKDNDFFNRQFAIITFNKGDINNYKVEGRTAGIWSHACKHLDEIDSAFVDNIIQQIKRTLIDYVEQDNHPKAYEFNYFNSDKKIVKGDPLTLVKQASRASIINFLDLVNDKYQLKKELSPIEQKMIKFLEKLGDQYGKHIQTMIDKATNIDRLESDQAKYDAFAKENVIEFSIIGLLNGERPMKIFLDIPHNYIIIKTGEFVNTMYKVDYRGSGRKALLNAFNKKVLRNARFANRSTYRAFSNYLEL